MEQQLSSYPNSLLLPNKKLIFIVHDQFIVQEDKQNIKNLTDFFENRNCIVILVENDPNQIRRLVANICCLFNPTCILMYMKCRGEGMYTYLPTYNPLQPNRKEDRMSFNEAFSILKSYCNGPKIVLADLIQSERPIIDIRNEIAYNDFTAIQSTLEPSLPEVDYHLSVCYSPESNPFSALLHSFRTAKDQGGFSSLNDLIDRTLEGVVGNGYSAYSIQRLQTPLHF